MTGMQSMLAVAAVLFAVMFFMKVILRLVSRPVVKNYVTIPPQQVYPTQYYPIAPPVMPMPFYPQQHEHIPLPAIADPEYTADRQDRRAPARSEDEVFEAAFDDLVRDYYER